MNRLKEVLGVVLLSFLSGCGGGEGGNESASNNTNPADDTEIGYISTNPAGDVNNDDVVRITSSGSQSFRIVWEKKTEGLSEIVYTDDPNLADGRRGKNIYGTYEKGTYSFDCYLNTVDDEVNINHFLCMGSPRNTAISLFSNRSYYIRTSEQGTKGYNSYFYHSPNRYKLVFMNYFLTILQL